CKVCAARERWSGTSASRRSRLTTTLRRSAARGGGGGASAQGRAPSLTSWAWVARSVASAAGTVGYVRRKRVVAPSSTERKKTARGSPGRPQREGSLWRTPR